MDKKYNPLSNAANAFEKHVDEIGEIIAAGKFDEPDQTLDNIDAWYEKLHLLRNKMIGEYVLVCGEPVLHEIKLSDIQAFFKKISEEE